MTEWMDYFALNHWTWFVIAVIFLGLEIAVPGVVFLWMAIASALVGGIVLFIPTLVWEMQFIVFAALSIVSVFAGRRFLKKHPIESDDLHLNQRGDHFIGQTFTLLRDMDNGRSKVRIGDGNWIVEGDFEAAAGEKVKIIGRDGTVLKAEKIGGS